MHAARGYYDKLDACISFHPAFSTMHANTVVWDTHCGSYWSKMYTFECPHAETWSGMGAGPGASAVLRLAFEPGRLRVEVADDGTGLTNGADGRGNGLRGIAERVAVLGGELETGAADGGGFRLCSTLPLQAPEITSVPR